MSNQELKDNKKKVVLKLVENGDMPIYEIREMNLKNSSTGKRVTPTGINTIVKKLNEIGAINVTPSDNGDIVSARKENIIYKRSTESLKGDSIFLFVMMIAYAAFYFFIFTDLYIMIGAMSAIAITTIYIFIKAVVIPETKSIFVKQK